MPRSIGPKWFGLWPPYYSGSGHATISDTWITICFTINSNKLNYCLQTNNFSVFIAFFSSLSTKITGITTATTMAAACRNGPLAPHMRPCTPRRCFEWMGDKPPSLRMYFWGWLRCLWPSKCSFVPAMMQCHNIGVLWGPYTPSTARKCLLVFFFTVRFHHVPFLWGWWFHLGMCCAGFRLRGGVPRGVGGVAWGHLFGPVGFQ